MLNPPLHQPVANRDHPAGGWAQGRLPRARAHGDDGRRPGEAVARGDQEAYNDAAMHGKLAKEAKCKIKRYLLKSSSSCQVIYFPLHSTPLKMRALVFLYLVSHSQFIYQVPLY